MIKEPSITSIIRKIKTNPELADIVIVDYWEADLCAIGIQTGGILVYISTYDKPDNHYYLVTEKDSSKDPKSNIEIDNISDRDLMKKLIEIFADD